MKKKKRGRPPIAKTELRRETISLRLKSDEVALLREAASKNSKNLSTWVRDVLLDKGSK